MSSRIKFSKTNFHTLVACFCTLKKKKKLKTKRFKKRKEKKNKPFSFIYIKLQITKKRYKILKYKAIAVSKTAQIERASKFLGVLTNNRDPAILKEVEGRGNTNAETSNYKNLEE